MKLPIKKKQSETPHPQPPKKKKTDKQKQDLIRIQNDILSQITACSTSFGYFGKQPTW